MFAATAPTKAETKITQKVNNQKLESVITITTGNVDGKVASTLVNKIQTLRSVTDGKLDVINEKNTFEWYYEGQGTTTNGRKWDAEGTDFAPKAGDIMIDLKNEYFTSVEHTEDGAAETLVLVIAEDEGEGYAKKALANFLGEDMEFGYETTITIIATGGRISTVIISYIVSEHEVGDEYDAVLVSDMEVSREVNYSYEPQTINFEK